MTTINGWERFFVQSQLYSDMAWQSASLPMKAHKAVSQHFLSPFLVRYKTKKPAAVGWFSDLLREEITSP